MFFDQSFMAACSEVLVLVERELHHKNHAQSWSCPVLDGVPQPTIYLL